MNQQQQFKKYTKDDNFDFDGYLDERSSKNQDSKTLEEDENPGFFSFLKNIALAFTLMSVAFLWYFDWNPGAAFRFITGQNGNTVSGVSEVATTDSEESVVIEFGGNNQLTINGEEFNFDFDFDFGDEELPATSPLNMSFTEYMAELKNNNLLDYFGSSSLQTLYTNNVPISYLANLKDIGIVENFGGSSISTLYSNNIPIEYLTELQELGIIDQFGGNSITTLFNNKVSTDYLEQLNEIGVIELFGGTSISNLYRNEIPVEYIKALDDEGFIDYFSSTSISNLYNNEIPVSYLRKLEEMGILEDMSSSSIITAYNLEDE